MVVADRLEVLVVLQHRAERRLDDLRVQLLPAEGRERLRPVDRLGDARRLREIEPAEAGDETGDLLGESLGDPRDAKLHDLDLALESGVADPVEETAPLEGVVELTRPVRRQDDDRAPVRLDRPDLRDRDLEVGEHLEEEGLELVVRAVDLVDEEDDRLLALDRLEERPADQEVGPKSSRSSTVPSWAARMWRS